MPKPRASCSTITVPVLALAFFDHIDAGDAEIDAAIAHADDDIGRALEEHVQLGQGGDAGFILARVGLVDLQAAGARKSSASSASRPLEGSDILKEGEAVSVMPQLLDKKTPRRPGGLDLPKREREWTSGQMGGRVRW